MHVDSTVYLINKNRKKLHLGSCCSHIDTFNSTILLVIYSMNIIYVLFLNHCICTHRWNHVTAHYLRHTTHDWLYVETVCCYLLYTASWKWLAKYILCCISDYNLSLFICSDFPTSHWCCISGCKERWEYLQMCPVYVSLLSRIVFGGDKRHLADSGWHRFLPDLNLDGCSVFSKRCIHVRHGDVLFQAGRRAATGDLT